MRRTIIVWTVAAALAAFATAAVAASFTCKVKEASGTEAVLKCKAKDVKKVAVGDKVKIKKKTEGC